MKQFFFFIIFVMVFVGCSYNQSEDNKLLWWQTEKEAIKNGLKQEGINSSAILSKETINDETIIFYKFKNDSIGIGTIAESEKGFSWYPNGSYVGFKESDTPFSVSSISFKTYKGQIIKVLVGKVFDPSIKEIILKGDGLDRQLRIAAKSKMFYTIYNAPFSTLRLSPIKNYEIIEGIKYFVLQKEIFYINNKTNENILKREYDVYDGRKNNISQLEQSVSLPDEIEIIDQAKNFLLTENPEWLKLKPYTIVSENVLDQWKNEEGYVPKLEYWSEAPEGLTIEQLKSLNTINEQ